MPNELVHEQSVYLLQHAHNPVQWHPWSDHAFELARQNQKPLLISIGYAACHWCHVMEKESFEDEQIAAFMNENFICVKVDREEHPDVDDFYITAVQAISGSAGWPLNVFVTPDKLPFYGGTYFPPNPAYGRPSWKQILEKMHSVWVQRNDEVTAQSNQLLAYLNNANQIPKNNSKYNDHKQLFKDAFNRLMQQADSVNGGFGGAPKFPTTMPLMYILEHAHFMGDYQLGNHAYFTVEQLINSGIYDWVSGGFSRYTVDAKWEVPHFEKMLYDNALLIQLMCAAYQQNTSNSIRKCIEETVEFCLEEFMAENQGFYSAYDADSEGVEGKYYTWNLVELKNKFPETPQWIWDYLDFYELGNWEEVNIIHPKLEVIQQLQNEGINAGEIENEIFAIKAKLKGLRQARIKPILDDKMLLSWNALMNNALTHSGVALQQTQWLEIAQKHMDWMLNAFQIFDAPKHVFKAGLARIEANMDDLSYLVQSLLSLSAALNEEKYKRHAQKIIEFIIQNYSDTENLFFQFSSHSNNNIPLKSIDVIDNVLPSSNAIMAHNLVLSGVIFSCNNWIERGKEMVNKMINQAVNYPNSYAQWLIVAQRIAVSYKSISIVGADIHQIEAEMKKKFAPHAYIFFEKKENFVTMPNRNINTTESQIFICNQNECFLPTTTLPETIDFAIL
jgi:uncharacterized protein YyaL (SSP411 family)